METQTAFDWDDRYLLGYEAMDDTHREFVTLVNDLLTVEDAALPAALDAFAAHAEAHFAQENAWMDLDGFPARDCHVDEHDKGHGEGIAHAHEAGGLLRAGGVEAATESQRIVGHHAHGAPAEATEGHDDVGRPARMELDH